ncbi:hypothetical protein D187_004087 [Cystobacter fuscus DSM 2262]|uniref:D-isomer specific 2-hydroxyacid dehydrogenase NAD-binding domain-containing protein n=1 Tax=Cystobacter fuscus (strain ATCC 25194 / DSM 2262 / NBRC 100088 / M29) TaxID=1242864 RepID=S9P550_CYSF2|nr:NAD(P)-dependent oxidoreductase [Cystobacter fuscus]EPX58331.1 hypothetical protein D187_004087 [Cystobacter fuscus DSM 2262]
MRIAFISRSSGYRPLAERLAAKLPAHEVVVRGTSRPLVLEGVERALKTEAMEVALRSERLGGAGLDVFWQEPVDPRHPILLLRVGS